MLDMLPMTRSHGLESTVRQQLELTLGTIRHRGLRMDLVGQAFASASWSLFQVAHVVFLGIGAYLVINGELSIGHLVMLAAYFTMTVDGAAVFSMLIHS